MVTASSKASQDRPVTVVSGAAQGIGARIAIRLAHDGFDLALLDLSEASETVAAVEAEGPRSLAVRGDITDTDAVGAAADEVTTRSDLPRCS